MAQVWSWDEMLAEFRALGGVADNVVLKEGALGRGLFPIDPSRPFILRTPPNLLFPVGTIAFEHDELRLRDEARATARERAFFEQYQAAFSWGAYAQVECTEFAVSADALPENIRAVLKTGFAGLARMLFDGSIAERAQRRFVNSRCINFHETMVLMPVIELVNHGGKGIGFNTKDGISIAGTTDGEILARYKLMDPYGFFRNWGFASPEKVAFSLPVQVPLGGRTLIVKRDLPAAGMERITKLPSVTTRGNSVIISHLLLGHAQYPRLAKGIFYRLADDLGLSKREELFDKIQHLNRMRLLDLGAALEDCRGLAASQLRKTCNYQLAALSYSIGRRAV